MDWHLLFNKKSDGVGAGGHLESLGLLESFAISLVVVVKHSAAVPSPGGHPPSTHFPRY